MFLAILITVFQCWGICCNIGRTVAVWDWLFSKHVSFSVGAHTNSWRLASVWEWRPLTDECCLQNKEICYRNVNFGFTRSLAIYWYFLCFNWLTGGGPKWHFRDYGFWLFWCVFSGTWAHQRWLLSKNYTYRHFRMTSENRRSFMEFGGKLYYCHNSWKIKRNRRKKKVSKRCLFASPENLSVRPFFSQCSPEPPFYWISMQTNINSPD